KELEIIFALTHRIRVASADQIIRTWWPKSCASGERALRRLRASGQLQAITVQVHPELSDLAPVWRWSPGGSPPPFGPISYRLWVRWTQAIRRTVLYVASTKAARRMGGYGGRLSHPLQAGHDLHVSAIYFKLLQSSPADAALWVPEQVFSRERRGE